MSGVRGLWSSAVRFLGLRPVHPKPRLTEAEALAIGRRGIAAIAAYRGEKPKMGGRVPDEAFMTEPLSTYDGPLWAYFGRREGDRTLWEATTNDPGFMGGHLKVFIDDETGRIVSGFMVPL